MRVPLWLRTSADSHAGSYLVELRDRSYFRTHPNASCCTKILHVVQRIFAMLKVEVYVAGDIFVLLNEGRFGYGSIKDVIINLIATVALIVLAFGIPFGYIPKVHYIRGYDKKSPLPIHHANPRPWHEQIESHPAIIEIISRADEYDSIQALENAIKPHLTDLALADPASAQGPQNDVTATLLYLAAEHKLYPLLQHLIQLGAPINAEVPLRLAAGQNAPNKVPLTSFAAFQLNSYLLSILLTKGADPNQPAPMLRGLTPLDFALIDLRKIDSFPQPNGCCFRIRRWWTNRKTINFANQLIKAGARFNRLAFADYYREVCNWDQMTPAGVAAGAAQRAGSLNTLIAYYDGTTPGMPIAPKRIHHYASNLHFNIIPHLIQA